ncbi:MAG: WecB/TagA/CpsF family glycosyltransferase [Deltaproteobacteria bacterium]|nr:WecB/TagA/CpsF family glycosyltransferase [Deltaproteobacteria bacterium]
MPPPDLPRLPRPRARPLGVEVDAVTLDQAAAWVIAAARTDGPFRYVVTPNLDHSLRLADDPHFRAAYAGASLSIADGWPVVAASRVFGPALPERVTGSDLVPRVFELADPAQPLRVFLLGAAPGVGLRAASRLRERYPGVRVVGVEAPEPGFEHDPAENARLIRGIRAAGTELLVVGLGAPKQELWSAAHAGSLGRGVGVCVGATIDFLAGERRRAPPLLRGLGVEWLHRLASEPRRLGPRYARNALGLPRLIAREWQLRISGG